MHYENPEESFEGIRKLWGNMLSFWFFADFEWVFCNFHKYLAWFLLIYPLCLETISEKNCFLVFFSLVNSDFERNCLDYWKKNFIDWKHFLPRVPRTFGEKKFSSIFFFQNVFRTLREKFPDLWRTFDRQGLQGSIFFLPETLCDAEQFFPSERDNYKNFLTSDREFFGFLVKKVSRDFRI